MEIYPLKEWLRQNPQHIPQGLDATNSTSHQLRNGLKRKGWKVQSTDAEVRLLMPGANDTRVEEVLGDDEATDETPLEFVFELEAQLRDFLAHNLEKIPLDGSKLKLRGVEYPTDAGPIDILAENEAGEPVVFELKRGRTSDHTMGQLTRYMGWIKENMSNGKTVHGVIVARNFDKKLHYAKSAIPNVSLLKYEVSFDLKTAEREQ